MADVERALPTKSADKDLLVAVTTLLVAPTLGLGLSAVGMPDVVVQHSVPASITVVAILLLRRHDKRLAARQLDEVAGGQADATPLVVLILVASILLLESLIGALVGSIVGSTVMAIGGTAADIPFAVVSIGGPYTLLLLLLWMVPMGFFASSRIGRHAILWILLAIVISRVLRLALLVALSPIQQWLSIDSAYTSLELLAIQPPLMLLLAWIGHRIARSRHSAFLLLQSFRKLGPADRQAVLGLLTEPEPESSPESGAGDAG